MKKANFKKKLLLYLLFSLSSLTVLAHKEKIYSLEGTIGNREIIMEIVDIDGYYNGRYSFRDEKKSNYLEVEYDSITFTFNLLRYNLDTKNRELIEQILITEDSLNNWSGEQKTPDGKVREVFLRPIKVIESEPHALKSDIKKNLTPYNYSLLRDITYESTSTQKFKNGVKIEWLTETRSKIKLFRFVKGFPDTTLVKINNYLEKLFIKDILNAYNYQHYETEIHISLVTPNILSMVEAIKSNISNTRETSNVMYLTLDLKTLNKLNIEDLIWLGEGETPRNGSKEYFIYRREVFAREIGNYLNGTYSKEINNSKCSYSNEKMFRFPEFYLTKKGMVLMLNDYKLSEKCKKQTWAVLRYKDFPEKWSPKYFN